MNREATRIRRILRNRPSVLFAYLFGSRVKGDANERSDWDVAVYLTEPMEEHGLWPAFEMEAELAQVLEGVVQVLILNTPFSPVLGYEVLREGVLLFERDRNLRMEFENRTLRRYYDWQYFLKRQMDAEGIR